MNHICHTSAEQPEKGPAAAAPIGICLPELVDDGGGEEGRKLLQYVYWSNGRETESPSVDNKQCPGKNLVVLVGRLLVVEMFLRYDTFTADVGVDLRGPKVEFTGVTKATSGPDSAV